MQDNIMICRVYMYIPFTGINKGYQTSVNLCWTLQEVQYLELLGTAFQAVNLYRRIAQAAMLNLPLDNLYVKPQISFWIQNLK